MDPVIASLILFAGLILVASVTTGLVVTSGPGPARSLPVVERHSSLSDAAVLVSIFCPKTDASANVGVGIDEGGPAPDLTVLQCERFPAGPVTCDMECLTASIAA